MDWDTGNNVSSELEYRLTMSVIVSYSDLCFKPLVTITLLIRKEHLLNYRSDILRSQE